MATVRVEEWRYRQLWNAIQKRLDRDRGGWRKQIDHFGQVEAVKRRQAGERWSDNQVFEALLRAVLSNNADWSKVESVLPELRGVFSGFSLSTFAATTDCEINERLIPWFQSRKAGSMTLKKSLQGLARASLLLSNWSRLKGSAETYFLDVVKSAGGDAKRAAVALGGSASKKKLPALGVPIAAETLRNLGFDVSKPDRHLCRAVGSFGLVRFDKWADRTGTNKPAASEVEMLDTMTAVEAMARQNTVPVSFADNAIWLLCARMGLYLSNDELAALARSIAPKRPEPA